MDKKSAPAQGTALNLVKMATMYAEEEPNQGLERSEKKSSWIQNPFSSKDKPSKVPKVKSAGLSKTLEATSEYMMDVSDISPLSTEEQAEAEHRRRLLEVQKIKEKDAIRKRHTNCISSEEGMSRQDRINTLESENANLKKDVDTFRDQLDKYWKVMKIIGPLFAKLRPIYQLTVDPETGQQPPDWTLSFCLQQLGDLESEKIEMDASYKRELSKKDNYYLGEMMNQNSDHEREKQNLSTQITEGINLHATKKEEMEMYFQQQLDEKGAYHQQQMRNKEAEHQREKQNLQNQICNVINVHEQKKEETKAEHDQAVEKLTADHKREKERLQGEVIQMESFLFTNVDRFQPLPDSNFIKRFTDLKKLVENVSRNLPEVEGAVMGRAFAETPFVRAAEFVEVAPKKFWRFLLEGTFWNIIMRGLFASPLSVFGTYGRDYLDYWHDLFERQRDRPEPGSEQWRSITFETLQKHIESRPMLKQSHEMNLRNISEELAGVLREFSQNRPDEIRNIVDHAHKLAIDIGIQRSRLQLFAPELGTAVKRNTRTYDDINNSNVNDLRGGVVQLVSSPGLRRHGDSRGTNFNEEPVDLWPAAVYLTRP